MYILDSDVISLMFRFPGQQPLLEQRIKSTPYEHLFISVISVEEAIQGAYRLMHQKKNPAGCYKLLAKIVMYYGRFQILPYDEEAMRVFDGFSAAIRRATDKGDRQIAATSLVRGYTVITRNLSHFQLTGARCADWTIP